MDMIRVYAEIGNKELGLLQISDYYLEKFRYEIMFGQTATVFPNLHLAQIAVKEFKKEHPGLKVDHFKYVTVLNYKV